jgi:Ni/Co efflux regulator RcnB
MRKLIISILLASAAASPALAQDQGDRGDRDRHHEQSNDRQQAREQRQQAREQVHTQRSGGGERPQFQVRQQQQIETRQQQQQVQSSDRAGLTGRQRADGVSRWTRDNVQQSGETARYTRDPNQRSGETSRWTRDRSNWTGGDRQRQYEQQRQYQQQRQVTQRSRSANGSWNRNWRNDRRYDWHSYRNNHRSVFHLGLYIDPFNYGYRSFNIGYRLQPSYYGQQYWFDPGMYGLPYPPPGTQWVRYWNDALLVDMYTGEVVDAIQNFFW